jgi:hypothetical protein
VRIDEGLNLGAQLFVTSTLQVDEGRPIYLWPFQGGLENMVDSLPALPVHAFNLSAIRGGEMP